MCFSHLIAVSQMQLGKPVEDPLLQDKVSKTKLLRKEHVVTDLLDHLNGVYQKVMTVKNFVSELVQMKEGCSSAKAIELITMVEEFDRTTFKRIISTTALIETKCLERKKYLSEQLARVVNDANTNTNTNTNEAITTTINNRLTIEKISDDMTPDEWMEGNSNFRQVCPNSPRNLLGLSRQEEHHVEKAPVVVSFNIVPSNGTTICPLSDIPSCAIGEIIGNDLFIDGLGGYMVFFTLLTKVVDLLIQTLMKIASAKTEINNFTVYSTLLEQLAKVMKHASYLAQIYELIYRSINEVIGETEINEMMNLIEIPPFWYEYGAGLPQLKYVIELVKSSTFHSTKNNNDTNDSLDILSVGYHSVKQLSRKIVGTVHDAEFVELHRSSNVQTLKAFFNLPDHPLCRNFTSLVLPAILTSKKIWIPRRFADGTHAPVCCLLLYNHKFPFNIPPEYFNAPSPDGFAKSPSRSLSSKSNANLSDSTKRLLHDINIELDVILHFHGGIL